MRKIVLASASPRRKELLEQIGLEFEVDPGGGEEPLPGTSADPHSLARYLSRQKAQSVSARHKDALIIAADTFVVFEGRILGKPGTAARAREMLESLGGKAHLVITGFTLLDTQSGESVSESVETPVFLKKLAGDEIEAYIRSGEPLDKAGAYAIQGLGAVIVEKIEGDYSNVVGLPLSALAETLKEFGVNLLA